MNNNLIENRQIRVFISSTFQDMQDERDELMKKTFPVLRQKAAERDVTLTELDLRWGITPEESESGKVVEICLREIENSVPFFVGIIGNRYGWIPSAGDLGEGLTERFSQVKGYVERHLSVTEMEMQFGVLERKENMHAFFYIKEQEDVSVDEPEKLAKLKEKVRENGRYPVSTYSTVEDLAMQVEDAFTKLLDELYPEGTLSELEKERIGQRAYLNSLCQNYIRTESNFAAIEEWVSDWEKHQLVITGASGLGKSALVANWVKEKLAIGEGLPYRIIYHFVGNGGSLGSHGHVIKALCDEIRDRYGFDTEDKEAKTDEKALEGLFNRVAAEGDKPLVIVLDAVNQIIDTEHSKRLNWLPIPPGQIKLLFTTLEDDETMEVFKGRHYPVLTLQPLSQEQQKDVIQCYLSLYSKKLQPSQVDRIVNGIPCNNTLVLKSLLDELINFGIYEKLEGRIGSFLGTASIESFYQILLRGYEEDFGEPLVRHALSLITVSRKGLSEGEILAITQVTPLRWSQFFCSFRRHMVPINGLISFSHNFIRQAAVNRYIHNQEKWERTCRQEIASLLCESKDHRAMDEVPYQYDHLGDLAHLGDYLLDWSVFSYLFKAERDNLGKYWRRLMKDGRYSIKDYLSREEAADPDTRMLVFVELSDFTSHIVEDYDLSFSFAEHALLYAATAKDRADIYTREGFSMSFSGDHDLALSCFQLALTNYRAIFKDNNDFTAMALLNVGSAYSRLGDVQKALSYFQEALDMRNQISHEDHPETAVCLNNLGVSHNWLGNYQKALEYHQKALEIRLKFLGRNHPDTAQSYSNLSEVYMGLGDHQRALDYEWKALQILLDIFGENHSSTCLVYLQIARTYNRLHDYQKVLTYADKALNIRRIILGDNHPDTADLYHDVSAAHYHLGNYQEALVYLQKALDIVLSVHGPNHFSVYSIYRDFGLTYTKLEDYSQALEYELKAMDGFLERYGEHHTDSAEIFNDVSILYQRLGDNEQALTYAFKALDLFTELHGEHALELAGIYMTIGFCHDELDDHPKKIRYLQKAIDEVKYQIGEDNAAVASLTTRIAKSYGILGEKDKEIEFRKKGLEIAERVQAVDLIPIFLNRLGHAYTSIGETNTANGYFRQAAEKYRELGDEEQAQENLAMIEE